MNKKIKIIIAVSVIVIVATTIGVLSWGLQPVDDKVSLQDLNKKLDGRYSIPSQMPFAVDAIECYVSYDKKPVFKNRRTRFEASKKNITGYTIRVYDFEMGRDITIATVSPLSQEDLDVLLVGNYKDKPIYFFCIQSEKLHWNVWFFLFVVNNQTYRIDLDYDENIDNETVKSDIEFLLDQMIA